MGIDYDGGMIVGEHAQHLAVPDDYEENLFEWAEDNEMTTMSQWYDAGEEGMYCGFEVPNVPVAEMGGDWLKDVQKKAAKFKELTGVSARLIGTQNIW